MVVLNDKTVCRMLLYLSGAFATFVRPEAGILEYLAFSAIFILPTAFFVVLLYCAATSLSGQKIGEYEPEEKDRGQIDMLDIISTVLKLSLDFVVMISIHAAIVRFIL